MSCCGLRPQITSLNSLFQKVHLNEVKPRVPVDTHMAGYRPGCNTSLGIVLSGRFPDFSHVKGIVPDTHCMDGESSSIGWDFRSTKKIQSASQGSPFSTWGSS